MDGMLKVLGFILFGVPILLWRVLRVVFGIVKYVWQLIRTQKGLTTHGDADWATDKGLRKAGAFEPYGSYLLAFTKSGKRIYGRPRRGVIVLAGPGQGKSQNALANFKNKMLVEPNRREHLLIHDPADELYTRGKSMLEEAGYVIEKIDTVNPSLGIRYDVQSYLDPKSMNYRGDLQALCELLIAPEPNSRQPHFVDYARKMLQDVITLNLMFEGGKRTLAECVDELLNDKKRDALIKRMEKYPYDFNAMEIFAKMKGDEGVGMQSTSLRKLDVWTFESMRRIGEVTPTPTNQRGWSFEDMLSHDKPCALFVRTGLAPGGGEFARVVFGNAINTIRRQWDATGIPNPRGLQAFIDEAARLGTCNALLDGHNELRKANYSQWLGFLSFSAMKHWYGEEAKTLFNGCDHIVLPGNQDMEVNETYSKMIGDMTIESGSRNQGEYGETSGKNEQARRRVKADELRRADEEISFAIRGNLNIKGLRTFSIKKGKPVLR
ncbi:type IV secretion system protein VirD4 [Bradyrhizobium sp. LB8.2]|uniref:type IV secretory system conjugative DNA transfer family protein n=1 Tax=unclassified Bradyrhizobium TaxID=2631580 RepID=UPI003391673E